MYKTCNSDVTVQIKLIISSPWLQILVNDFHMLTNTINNQFVFQLTNVSINLNNLLDAVGLHQGRGDPLLHGQAHPLGCLDTYGCGAQLGA